jgi:DNA polymerase
MAGMAKAARGYLPVPSNYYGSHTGRSSGGKKINLFNLGGAGRAGSGTHPLIQKMRNVLRAPYGNTFGISDSAQIEARILAWLSGCTKLTEGFARGEDIYSEFATELFGEKVWKPSKHESLTDEQYKTLTIRRGFGKDTILGCGFGLGPSTFYDKCLENRALRPLFDSGQYDLFFVTKLIETYRSTYREIPLFWKTVENMFKCVVKFPTHCTKYGAKELGLENDLLQMWNDNGTVNIQLPSGRILFYPHAKLTKLGDLSYTYSGLWGGSLTENIVQATARDFLVYWIRLIENTGITVVHHVYDEIITLLDEEEPNIELVDSIMKTAPAWGEGVPLEVESKLSKVYTK